MDNSSNQMADNCLFCRKDVQTRSFASSEGFCAIYNIAPILPGHSLVIPLKHFRSLFDLSDEELGEMMIFARKVTSVLEVVFGCKGFDWSLQDGIAAGQTVPHLHLHIIPRRTGDMPGNEEWYSKILPNEKFLLDSQSRERLNENSYMEITEKLIEASKSGKI